MHWQTPAGTPDWQDGRDQRLAISMLFATALVAGLLSLVRMPVAPDLAPISALLVNLVRDPSQAPPDERPRDPPPPDVPVDERSD